MLKLCRVNEEEELGAGVSKKNQEDVSGFLAKDFVVVAFSSLARIWGSVQPFIPPPALFLE